MAADSKTMLLYIVLFASAALALVACPAAANTILAAGTPGEPGIDFDARAVGMGGAAFGLFDGSNVNGVNPAVPASYGRAVFSVTLFRGYNSYETPAGKSVEITFDIPRVELAVPVSSSLALSLALRQELNQNYELTRPLEYEGVVVGTSRRKGTGSVYSFSAGLAGRLGERWYLGGAAGYDFGAPKEIYSKEFKEKGYSRIEETLETAYKGVKGALGAGYLVTDKFSVGAQLEVFSTHRVHETVFTEYATLYEEDRRFAMPWSAGLGAAYVVGPRGRFTADVRYTAWSRFAVDGEDLGYRDTVEFHAGAEGRLTAARKSFFLWRMPFRAGVSYVPWYSTEHGEFAKTGVAVGAGYLFKNNENSRLDVALEYSRRGDSPSRGLKEEMFDFCVSIVGLEEWIGKRGRED
ncbi:MAG: hypothetical protein V3W11_10400 [bacterium]